MNGDAPDLDLIAESELKGWVVGVGGFQSQAALMPFETFEREGTVEHRNHDVAWAWVKAAIHNQQIPMLNPGVGHRVATDPEKERADGMADQLFIEINANVDVVVGGRGEAGGDMLHGHGQSNS